MSKNLKSKGSWLLRTLVAVTAFMSISLVAFAAIDDYTVTGGNPGALPNVGAAAVTLPEITLTDVGGDDFTGTSEEIIVAINDSTYGGVVFDETIGVADLILIGGTCGYDTIDDVTYTDEYTAVITVSGSSGCDAGETVVIGGLFVETIYSMSAPGAAALINVDNSTTSSGSAVDTSNTVNLAVAVGALTSTDVDTQSKRAGKNTGVTISFTSGVAMSAGAKIQVTFPAGYDVSGLDGETASNISGADGTWTAGVSGQVVTLTQSAGTEISAGAISLFIDGIVTPTTTGSTGVYDITTLTGSDAEIQTDAAVTADTIITGSSSSTSSKPTSEADVTYFDEDGNIIEATEETTTEEATTEETTTEETTTEDSTAESFETVKFSDTSTHWANTEVTAMVEAGVVNGYADGTFKPENNLLRSEAATLLYRVLGLNEPATPEKAPFTDVAADSWYAGYVAYLKEIGIVGGNPDGTYAPASNINRAEFLTLALNTYYYLGDDAIQEAVDVAKAGADGTEFADVEANDWYMQTAGAAKELGFIKGYACGENMCFNAGNNITRAEATKILYNMFIDILMPEDSSEAESEAVVE